MSAGIYAIRNIVTNKYYVGSTVNFKQRWADHRTHLKRGSHHSIKLQRSFNKHGLESFEFLILKEVEDLEKLREIEQEFIELYQAWDNGYNILKQGEKRKWLTNYDGVEKPLRKTNPNKKNKVKKITTVIPDIFDEKLREVAKAEGRSISNLVSIAIEKFLREYKPVQLNQAQGDQK